MQRNRMVFMLLCAIATVTLCLAVAPEAAQAANAQEVYIWGRKLDAATPYYVNGDNGAQGTTYATEPSAVWNAHYDPNTGLLELNNLSVKSSTAEMRGERYALYAPGDVTINTISGSYVSTQTDESKAHKAIWIEGDLTLQSSNDQTFKAQSGGGNQLSSGVWVSGGNLTLKSGRLDSAGGSISNTDAASAQGNSYGVNVEGVVTVEDGALVCEGGTITVSAGNAHCASYGLASQSVVVTGGSLNAFGGSVNAGGNNAYSYGAYTTGTTSPLVTVSGGVFSVRGRLVSGGAASASYGVFFANVENGKHLQYTGGTVKIEAGTRLFNRYDNAREQLPFNYCWKFATGGFFSFPGQPYTFSDGQTYVEFSSPLAVNYMGLTANGGPGQTTTELTLQFDWDVPGFTADHLTLTGAAKGALTAGGSVGEYKLAISAITVGDQGSVRVAVRKEGIVFTPEYRDTQVRVDRRPAILSPTSDLTVAFAPGDRVTLTVTARNAMLYQWQKNNGTGWEDIPGADGPSYTTPPLTEANDGERYRCVVFNDSGHVESPVFTLRLARSGGGAPKTGDRTPLSLLCALLLLSGAGFAAARGIGRGKRQSPSK